jgi:hypothetical protein
LAVSTADSAEAAIARADESRSHAIGNGLPVNLPAQRRHGRAAKTAEIA